MTLSGLDPQPPDLAIIIVSYGSAAWLPGALQSIGDHKGALDVCTVVVDNDPSSACAEVLASHPDVRRVRVTNHGFGHANNAGLAAVRARNYLFLNPDTVLTTGSLESLVRELDRRPEVGLVGALQTDPDGRPQPTMRTFPSLTTALGDALGLERFARRPDRLGERILDLDRHRRPSRCDWVTGSFMLVPQRALDAAGHFDERFFLYSEETDLARRIVMSGFAVEHWPDMSLIHFEGRSGATTRSAQQLMYARRQYARKHFGTFERTGFLALTTIGLLVRLTSQTSRRGALSGLRGLLQIGAAPYEDPPRTATTGHEGVIACP
jgi:N-acetylglucosaminyl-diphospho-decaprenol L-rhamnosyltransferase